MNGTRAESTARNGWIRVSKGNPCPICGKPDWCCISSDYTTVYCMRVPSRRQSRTGGGYFHRYPDTPQKAVLLEAIAEPHRETISPAEWENRWRDMRAHTHPDRLRRAAERLSTTAESLEAYGAVVPDDSAVTWPMYDSRLRMVGLYRRYWDGSKRFLRGSNGRGIIVPRWQLKKNLAVDLYVVEGATDACSLHSAGMLAIGRPSCATGGDVVGELLKTLSFRGNIVVLGERDKKLDNCPFCRGKRCQRCWPGLWGAEQTAKKIGRVTGIRPVVSLVPPQCKDARDVVERKLVRDLNKTLMYSEFF